MQITRFIARFLFIPTLCWSFALSRILKVRRWWDRADDHVLIGALPFSFDVKELVAEGVRAVVNTCEEYAGPVVEYEAAGIVQLRIPTIDFTSPSLTDVERAVKFINEHVDKGETVYVHCKAGRGRSATVVLCWLIDARGMTRQQAQKLLLKRRPHVNRHLFHRQVILQFSRRRSVTGK